MSGWVRVVGCLWIGLREVNGDKGVGGLMGVWVIGTVPGKDKRKMSGRRFLLRRISRELLHCLSLQGMLWCQVNAPSRGGLMTPSA